MGSVTISSTAKLLLTILLTAGVFQLAIGQDTGELIRWSTTPLQWSDFKEDNTVDGKYGKHAAKSHWRLAFKLGDKVKDSPQVQATVQAFFIPAKSWVNRKSIGNTKLLIHEQIHFDLVELYARLLRKELLSTSYNEQRYKKNIKRVYKRTMAALRTKQAEYDIDTRHGKDITRQAYWISYVRMQLEETGHLTESNIVVALAASAGRNNQVFEVRPAAVQ